MSEFLSQFYNIKIENLELSVKGWNWGTAKFKGIVCFMLCSIKIISKFNLPTVLFYSFLQMHKLKYVCNVIVIDTFTSLGSSLSFEVDKKPAFEIPLKDVSQATTAGKQTRIVLYSFTIMLSVLLSPRGACVITIIAVISLSSRFVITCSE